MNSLRWLFFDDQSEVCADDDVDADNESYEEAARRRMHALEQNLLYPVAVVSCTPATQAAVEVFSLRSQESVQSLAQVGQPACVRMPRPAETARGRRLETLLSETQVPKKALAEMVWLGVPEDCQRCEAWQLLLDYRPLAHLKQNAVLQHKRREYQELRCGIYEGSSCSSKSGGEAKAAALQQIRLDLPRTEVCKGPGSANLQAIVDSELVQALMERVLFVWAMQQPDTGYVQGMNDVLLPLLFVFLADRTGVDWAGEDFSTTLIEALPVATLNEIEADCYWCLATVLEEVLDYYIPGQPGLRHATDLLIVELQKSNPSLIENFENQGAEIKILTMRTLGCLMVRELPLSTCARLWDTCIAESALGQRRGFSDFLLNFITCFVTSYGKMLSTAPFDDLMDFLLRPPVRSVRNSDLDILISEAFVLGSMQRPPLTAAQIPKSTVKFDLATAEHESAQAETPQEVQTEVAAADWKHIELGRHHSSCTSQSALATTSAAGASLLSCASNCSSSHGGLDPQWSDDAGELLRKAIVIPSERPSDARSNAEQLSALGFVTPGRLILV
eukprot:TRINITY_DN32183_c0_g1_i1.p1 TRINITY_DN32183_c0_g1~~TRINITY_DN32183_c0_g1_i1.p1  ORF type:complete len:574 (+),score=105.93 TRINITY_DN32183_c0_g1_i1:40-1722(+)